jgi:TctA family transporter
MIYILFSLVAISCLASLTALSIAVLKKSRSNAITLVLSVVGIITGFIALALAAPRDYSRQGVDYLGFIVAVLAVFATLLLGMQLYHVFRMKEDADEVTKAKQQIDEYVAKMEGLAKRSEELEKKINTLNDIMSSI